jgi:hypothetical protein
MAVREPPAKLRKNKTVSPRSTRSYTKGKVSCYFDLVRIRLLPAGMDFGAFGENVIRPGLLLDGRLRHARGLRTRGDRVVLRGDIPVFRSVGNAPDVSLVVERSADEEAVIPQGKTVRDASSYAASAGEIANYDRRF